MYQFLTQVEQYTTPPLQLSCAGTVRALASAASSQVVVATHESIELVEFLDSHQKLIASLAVSSFFFMEQCPQNTMVALLQVRSFMVYSTNSRSLHIGFELSSFHGNHMLPCALRHLPPSLYKTNL